MDRNTGFFRICWDNLLSLIVLNLLFLLGSVPLVTLPAAFAALCRGTQTCLRGDAHPVRQFLAAFRRELFSALAPGLLFLLFPACLLYGCVFYRQAAAQASWLLIPSVFCLVAVYLLLCCGHMAFHMLARVQLSAWQLIRNSVLLMLQVPRLLFTWLAAAVWLPVIALAFFPHSLPLLLLLIFAVSALCSGRGVLPIIETTILKEE